MAPQVLAVLAPVYASLGLPPAVRQGVDAQSTPLRHEVPLPGLQPAHTVNDLTANLNAGQRAIAAVGRIVAYVIIPD